MVGKKGKLHLDQLAMDCKCEIPQSYMDRNTPLDHSWCLGVSYIFSVSEVARKQNIMTRHWGMVLIDFQLFTHMRIRVSFDKFN